MFLPRSSRLNVAIVLLLLTLVALYCRLDPAPKPEPAGLAHFRHDLSVVLSRLGAQPEVSFRIVDQAGLHLLYSMDHSPSPQQADALNGVGRFVAQQNPGLQVTVSWATRRQEMAHTWLSDLGRMQLQMTDNLQRNTQRTLDSVLGNGQALALVDCQLMICRTNEELRGEIAPIRLATIPPYRVKQIRASVVLGHHPPHPEQLVENVARLTRDTLGIDLSRGDQLDVFQLP